MKFRAVHRFPIPFFNYRAPIFYLFKLKLYGKFKLSFRNNKKTSKNILKLILRLKK